jgi:hypothetical protein
MPQMYSTDHVLMAAQDMTDTLRHPQPDVPFVAIWDDTISALATLDEIFTRKFKKAEAVNTSGKAGAQIPQLPLGDDSPPWGG